MRDRVSVNLNVELCVYERERGGERKNTCVCVCMRKTREGKDSVRVRVCEYMGERKKESA